MTDRKFAEHHEVTLEALKKGIKLETGQSHKLVVKVGRINVRLPIDAEEAGQLHETYTLHMKKGDRCYNQVQKTQGDLVPGDGFADLEFALLEPDATYSLEVNPDRHQPSYFIFENIPYADLFPEQS